MLVTQYDLKVDESFKLFKFVSFGNKGEITKIVEFTQISDNFYNLGFGDLDENTGEASDSNVSNNGDAENVLATVAKCVDIFMEKHTDSQVYATGSTESRTRLYRIGITKYLNEISENYEIFGEVVDTKGTFQEFEKGVKYNGFLVRRRG
jgi:hypothetical protein